MEKEIKGGREGLICWGKQELRAQRPTLDKVPLF